MQAFLGMVKMIAHMCGCPKPTKAGEAGRNASGTARTLEQAGRKWGPSRCSTLQFPHIWLIWQPTIGRL